TLASVSLLRLGNASRFYGYAYTSLRICCIDDECRFACIRSKSPNRAVVRIGKKNVLRSLHYPARVDIRALRVVQATHGVFIARHVFPDAIETGFATSSYIKVPIVV